MKRYDDVTKETFDIRWRCFKNVIRANVGVGLVVIYALSSSLLKFTAGAGIIKKTTPFFDNIHESINGAIASGVAEKCRR